MKSKTYIAIPPGATIKEQLQDRGMKQKEFASRMDLSEKHISRLINGEVCLTPDVANRLELVLGIPANFWLNLEANYRCKIALVQEENELEKDALIAEKFPYSEMANLGWVKVTKYVTDQVYELRKFFEIAKLDLLNKPNISEVLFRRLSNNEKADYSLLAWVQKVRIESREIEVKKINIKRIQKSINKIKEMTSYSLEEFKPKLQKLLNEYGIALVILPHMKGSFLQGVSFKDNEKIVIGMTLRGKDSDKFWFSFFHELGHVILGHLNSTSASENEEKEADYFAQNELISSSSYRDFIEKDDFSSKSVVLFAQSQNIDAGIVVGRLQNDGYIPYTALNNLKTKFSFQE